MMNKFSKDLSQVCISEGNPLFEYILFKDEYVIAVNQYMLVKQHLSLHFPNPEDYNKLDGFAIHKSIFKEVYKYKEIEIEENGVLVCRKGKVTVRFKLATYDGSHLVDEDNKIDTRLLSWQEVIPPLNSKLPVDENTVVRLDVSSVLLDIAHKITCKIVPENEAKYSHHSANGLRIKPTENGYFVCSRYVSFDLEFIYIMKLTPIKKEELITLDRYKEYCNL